MSPILAPAIISIAITRQYSVITAWIVVTVVSKSATSWLIETFITDWSRTMMNCAPASATSGSHFFIGVFRRATTESLSHRAADAHGVSA